MEEKNGTKPKRPMALIAMKAKTEEKFARAVVETARKAGFLPRKPSERANSKADQMNGEPDKKWIRNPFSIFVGSVLSEAC